MHKVTVRLSISMAMLAGSALFFLTACDTIMPKSEPKPMTPIEETVEVSATVERVDPVKRLLSLKSETGESLTVQVDPAVRNLPQVKVGDRVVARYREAIGASISKAPAGSPSVDLTTKTAQPGQRPSGEATSTTNIPVTITAVDVQHHLVNFTGQDGLVRAITVETPQAKEFIKQLKPADTVLFTYTEAVAVSVEPAK